MKYSVVIPSYNSARTITDCLNAIASQNIGQRFETIVVDSSEDETPTIIQKQHPWVKLIHLPQRTDQGAARNIGIQQAQGEIIFLIDSDCTTRPDWMTKMLSWHEKGYQAVGGPVLNGNPDSVISWAGYFLEFNDLLPGKHNQVVWHIGSCNASYKREVFERYGGFPAGLRYALEDMLYNWYLAKRGLKMMFDQSITVHHYHRTTLNSYLLHQHKLGRGTVQLLRKTDLEGAYLVRHPGLASFVWPFIPFVKLFRTTRRVFGWQPTFLLKKPYVILVMFGGIMFWIAGFARELYQGEKKLTYVEAKI